MYLWAPVVCSDISFVNSSLKVLYPCFHNSFMNVSILKNTLTHTDLFDPILQCKCFTLFVNVVNKS